jgi:hypothetical protein
VKGEALAAMGCAEEAVPLLQAAKENARERKGAIYAVAGIRQPGATVPRIGPEIRSREEVFRRV